MCGYRMSMSRWGLCEPHVIIVITYFAYLFFLFNPIGISDFLVDALLRKVLYNKYAIDGIGTNIIQSLWDLIIFLSNRICVLTVESVTWPAMTQVTKPSLLMKGLIYPMSLMTVLDAHFVYLSAPSLTVLGMFSL